MRAILTDVCVHVHALCALKVPFPPWRGRGQSLQTLFKRGSLMADEGASCGRLFTALINRQTQMSEVRSAWRSGSRS